MVHTKILTAVAAALLLALPCIAGGLYSKNSPVVQVDAKNYVRLIVRSNYTSLVEFYAPWCGHCKSLQPAFEKAAKSLAGLVKLAAVNCDDGENKQFCGDMGVQGFPTLKIVKPGKKPGSPMVEDYNGPREAKAIVDTMVGKIQNHVKRITDKDLDKFLAEGNATAKAILFTEKGTTTALLKAVAIDFLGSITVAQVRNKEEAAVELFGITNFPSILLLPGGDAPGIVYEGEMKKDSIVAFLAQVAEPNPDPAPVKAKKPTQKEDKKTQKATKESVESTASSHRTSESSSETASVTEEAPEETSLPTESPEPAHEPEQKPIVIPDIPPIPKLASPEELVSACLMETSGTCVIAFVPTIHDEAATKALSSLAEIAYKHSHAKRKIFPFYEVPDDLSDMSMRKSLAWSGEVEIVAINRKRDWFMQYESRELSIEAVEIWIDQIRMGEGNKKRLSDAVAQGVPDPAATEQPTNEPEQPIKESDQPIEEPEQPAEELKEHIEELEHPTEESEQEPVSKEAPETTSGEEASKQSPGAKESVVAEEAAIPLQPTDKDEL